MKKGRSWKLFERRAILIRPVGHEKSIVVSDSMPSILLIKRGVRGGLFLKIFR
jgi:hypothetical protein